MKVLLVYANISMETLAPLCIAALATALEDSGIEVKLFDTTYYTLHASNDQADRIGCIRNLLTKINR